MSTEHRSNRKSIPEINQRKGGTPIVSLTAYTTPMARRLDPHVDFLLVGDSVGMVLYGLDEHASGHAGDDGRPRRGRGRAAPRARPSSLTCPSAAIRNCRRQAFRAAAAVMARTGASGVKLEGGREMAETIAFLVQRGIPVSGHVGLKPQSVH